MQWTNKNSHLGVLLLNSILTVEAYKAKSHSGRGWEEFTDAVVKLVSDKADHAVFIFWGDLAKKKKDLVDTDKHSFISGGHPSPNNKHVGFLGGNYFKGANDFLIQNGKEKINWIGLEWRNSVRKQVENENKSEAGTSAPVGELTEGVNQMGLPADEGSALGSSGSSGPHGPSSSSENAIGPADGSGGRGCGDGGGTP